jgi:hypothetical protein
MLLLAAPDLPREFRLESSEPASTLTVLSLFSFCGTENEQDEENCCKLILVFLPIGGSSLKYTHFLLHGCHRVMCLMRLLLSLRDREQREEDGQMAAKKTTPEKQPHELNS